MRRLLFTGALAGLLAFGWTLFAASSRPAPLPAVLGAHVLAGIVAAWLLSLASLGSLGARVRFVLLLATFAGLAALGVAWSSGESAVLPAALAAGRLMVGWGLGGLILAWRIAPS